MTVLTKKITLRTKGEGEVADITPEIVAVMRSSKLRNGVITVFVPGSTGAVTTLEFEPGILHDLPAMFERIAPRDASYQHEERWHDGNGHSHLRAALLGPSLTVPFVEGLLTLGTWQQIVFVEFDIRARSRELIIQIIGE